MLTSWMDTSKCEQEKQKFKVKHEGIPIIIINNLQVVDKMGIYNGEPL